jgi:benzoate-CoA ligase
MSTKTPRLQPDTYNATVDLMARNDSADRRDRVAVIDCDGSHTYAELNERINRFANLLVDRGIQPETRIVLCLLDTLDFPVCFLGAIKAGVVPVPVNTLLTPEDYVYLLNDSRAQLLVVSEALYPAFADHLHGNERLRGTIVSGHDGRGADSLDEALTKMATDFEAAPTRPDDIAFWLYTSGTTGLPKGAMHYQTDLIATHDTYSQSVLTLKSDDCVFSAAKLFFAYGLGNALTFPFAVGATALLLADRPTPESIRAITHEHQPTVFFGVPTLYAMMLNTGQLPDTSQTRLCVSAGEALPETIFSRWRDATDIEILDGIGSTEMLHIFVSNSPGAVRAGTSGRPVNGYGIEVRSADGEKLDIGEIGDLYVSGPSAAAGYWNLRATSSSTFQGAWVFTGDKYSQDADGYLTHCGRSDDLLKVGGIYVSPGEVENILLRHNSVAEVAVVGATDADDLIKPKAFVVVTANTTASDSLKDELRDLVRAELADYKRPRWVEFLNELPKTATGKIQRYKLRAQENS